jgi:hypothetical protein
VSDYGTVNGATHTESISRKFGVNEFALPEGRAP